MTEQAMPYDLANVPADYWERATNPERLRDLKTGARDMFSVPPSMIYVEEGHNPRNYNLAENREHLDELKRSIRSVGVQVPLLVRFDVPKAGEKKTAILVDGECRLRAVLELIEEGDEIRSVPVIQVEGKSETERLLLSITANTGKPLSEWELGEAFRRLIRKGWTEADVASKTGYDGRFVAEAIELADAPEEVKQMLSEKAVTPSCALKHLRKDGSAAAEIIREKVETAKANGTGIVKREKAATKPAPAPPATPAPASTNNTAKTVSSLVLYAAEELAKAVDGWMEDATAEAENKLVAAHKAYRKLIPAPNRGADVPMEVVAAGESYRNSMAV